MPQNQIDYSKTIMYKIVCKDLSITDLYIGHTTNLKKRKNQHKSNCNNINYKTYNLNIYKFIRENGNWDNWDMIKIEDYPCLIKLDALKRERELIESLNATLNSNIPSMTFKEYYQNNKEILNKKNKDYRENNKEIIAEKAKEYYENNKVFKIKKSKEYYENNKEIIAKKTKKYYENNKEIITKYRKKWYEENKEILNEKVKCDCGGCYTNKDKLRHLKTKKHKLYLNNILN